MSTCFVRRCTTALALFCMAAGVEAQTTVPPWSLRTRLLLTGSSNESDPAGFEVYSTFTIEAALARRLTRALAAELSIRSESREVDRVGETKERLGSLEFLPLNLLVQVRPFRPASVDPYFGIGANLTLAWEKTGVLDSMNVGPSGGIAAELGTDFALSERLLLNVDLRWNSQTSELSNGGDSYAKLHVHPLTIGIGLGFRL